MTKDNQSPANKTTKLDYAAEDIYIYAESRIEAESRAKSCAKEPETVEWIETNFEKGDVALDIGANIGAYTLIMSKLLGDSGMIYAFEPGWPNFYRLCKNIALNNCQHNIVPINMALSSQKRIDVMNYQDLEFGSSLHTFDKPVDFVGEKFKPEITFHTISYSVDLFAKEFKLAPVNHIKLDVDGLESEIINGAKEILNNQACRSLMVEFNEAFDTDQQSIKFLESCGFKIVKKKPNPSITTAKSSTVYNYVFKKD